VGCPRLAPHLKEFRVAMLSTIHSAATPEVKALLEKTITALEHAGPN